MLEVEPGLSNAWLARSLFVTAQTMHGILSNLEREKLVERHPDPDHGRALCGALTEEGARLLKTAHDAVGRVEDCLMEALGALDATKLTTVLLRCAERLG